MYSGQYPPPPPPNYAMLQHHYGASPPPYYAPQPYPYSQPMARRRSGQNCCIRFICCICCLLFLVIIFFATGLVLSYTFYKPKVPNYKLEDISVTSFNPQADMSLNAELEASIRAENPNAKIGFIYGKGSSITVSYEDSIICSGNIPAFKQGKDNTTIVKVTLLGRPKLGSDISNALAVDQRQGRIPLIVQVIVPVTVILDTFPLRQFELHVTCHISIDSLSPDKKPNILSSTYSFGFGF